MIRVDDLRKSYGSLKAVDGVTFDIQAGETFALLGPNGAGKTTTIHMMVGALKSDSGSISIDGATDPTRPVVRQKLGIAPQSLSLYEDLSAEENLQFFARIYGLHGPRLKERVDHALNFAGLADRRADHVKTYSGGMQRRLNLAAALVHEPKVLFLDEPTVGVDPQSRNYLFDNIEALKRAGCTILYTTHYMEEAERLCDRVAIMDHGKVLALDTVEGLISKFGGKSVILAQLDRPPTDPTRLPGRLDGLTLRIESEHPLEDVARLSSDGLRFTTLSIKRADLETVFLSLTGRTLRD